ncbi:hypothetical protein [Marinomonas sp. 2405UD68-3]|uniref:hypothetical protein n=1 Tax=Marinomonas sp. 2405UD68-3 TaxID=3391835 RepID=UPI0039C9D70C
MSLKMVGMVCPFLYTEERSACVNWVLSHPEDMMSIRQQVRQTIQQNFDLTRVCLPKQLERLVDSTL